MRISPFRHLPVLIHIFVAVDKTIAFRILEQRGVFAGGVEYGDCMNLISLDGREP